jgi:hypothetical protein
MNCNGACRPGVTIEQIVASLAVFQKDHKMSPLMIEMLLFIHVRAEVYDDRGGDSQRQAFQWMRREDLIAPTDGAGAVIFGQTHRTTERGAALVEKICGVELPQMVTTWV